MAPMIARAAGHVYAPGYEPTTYTMLVDYLSNNLGSQAVLTFFGGVVIFYWLSARTSARTRGGSGGYGSASRGGGIRANGHTHGGNAARTDWSLALGDGRTARRPKTSPVQADPETS
jgi:hypothetical protein